MNHPSFKFSHPIIKLSKKKIVYLMFNAIFKRKNGCLMQTLSFFFPQCKHHLNFSSFFFLNIFLVYEVIVIQTIFSMFGFLAI